MTIVLIIVIIYNKIIQCQTFSCYSLAIKIRRQRMFPADLPRLSWLLLWSYSCFIMYTWVVLLVLSDGLWGKALYDYEATCSEELSFQEGQMIRICSKEHDGVDDGWWVGNIDGTTGLFPSLVIEELSPSADDQVWQVFSICRNLSHLICFRRWSQYCITCRIIFKYLYWVLLCSLS